MSGLEELERHLDRIGPAEARQQFASLVAAMTHSESYIRSAAIAALSRSGIGCEDIRRRLTIETEDLVISDLCDAAAQLRDPESVPALEAIARENPSMLARASAVQAVVTLLGERARTFLMDRFLHERDERVRLEIDHGLDRCADDGAFDRIIEALHSEDHQVRCAAAALLTVSGDDPRRKRAVRALKRALRREMTVAVRSSIEQALDAMSS